MIARILRILGNTVLPILIIVAAILVAKNWNMNAARPKPKPVEQPGLLVEVLDAAVEEASVKVGGTGIVVAARQVALQSEVSGRVVEHHPSLLVGGRIRAGEVVVRIDPREYRIAVRELEAALEQARTRVELESGRRAVAEREWELFGEQAPDRGTAALALREPQMREATLQVEAAEVRLERAKLNLARTTITAPFDAIVHSESVEVGMLVSPQTQLATLVGTETFNLQVSIPLDRLDEIAIPGHNAEVGSPVTVTVDTGAARSTRAGRVLRLLGDVDSAGRMARILIEIDAPLASAPPLPGSGDGGASGPDGPPMLLGAFATAEIEGRTRRPIVRVPRKSLHNGDVVWVARPDDTLEVRPVVIAWREPHHVAVAGGLVAGDRVITTPIPTAVAGMKLRVAGTVAENSAPAAAPAAGEGRP